VAEQARAGGVATCQKRLMPFDDLLGDRRASLGGKHTFAVEAAGLVPEKVTSTIAEPRANTYWQTAPL
jgi:hypothetical protein